jgi:hypothetical protein
LESHPFRIGFSNCGPSMVCMHAHSSLRGGVDVPPAAGFDQVATPLHDLSVVVGFNKTATA